MHKIYTYSMKSKSKKYTRRQSKNKKHGGMAIGSGGYGCVFRPALACKNKTRKKNMVSKLLRDKHAKKEMSTIRKLKKIVKQIPNYQKYFLITNAGTCKPEKLSKGDLKQFEYNCTALEKHDHINDKNINKNLDKLIVLNLPDGGVSLSTYYEYMNEEENFNYINYELINLLKHAIIPMNDLHFYHGDIKDTNILYDTNSEHVSLIDWGLSFSYVKGSLPDIVKRRPFQYNLPFTLILFNNTFDKMYNTTFTSTKFNETNVKSFVKKYINAWNKERGTGHIDAMEDIWGHFTKSNITNTIIVPYISDVILSFGDEKSFHTQEYFEKVYVKIVDIWGFLLSYDFILEYNSFNKREDMCNIYKTYLLDNPCRAINITDLIQKMHNV